MGHKRHHDGSARHETVQRISETANPQVALHARIQRRAYELSRTGSGASELENWLQAERELAPESASQRR